jgi:hypothetical protein
MTAPDPDEDILNKLDRREARRKVLLPGIFAFADGCVAGLIAYEIMKRIFRWVAPAPLYGGLVVLIAVATWLFAKLSRDR